MGLLQTRRALEALHKQQILGIALGISCDTRFLAQLRSLRFFWHNWALEAATLAESSAWPGRGCDFLPYPDQF